MIPNYVDSSQWDLPAGQGISNDWRDAWTVGYTPYVTVGVWSGNNNNEVTAKVESLTGGGVIWHDGSGSDVEL